MGINPVGGVLKLVNTTYLEEMRKKLQPMYLQLLKPVEGTISWEEAESILGRARPFGEKAKSLESTDPVRAIELYTEASKITAPLASDHYNLGWGASQGYFRDAAEVADKAGMKEKAEELRTKVAKLQLQAANISKRNRLGVGSVGPQIVDACITFEEAGLTEKAKKCYRKAATEYLRAAEEVGGVEEPGCSGLFQWAAQYFDLAGMPRKGKECHLISARLHEKEARLGSTLDWLTAESEYRKAGLLEEAERVREMGKDAPLDIKSWAGRRMRLTGSPV